MNDRVFIHEVFCVLAAILFSQAAGAAVSQAVIKSSAAEALFVRCDRSAPIAVLDENELRGFLMALNEPLFEQFDTNCSGRIEDDEEAVFLEHERVEALKALDAAKKSVELRVARTLERERGAPIDLGHAERILPDPALAKMSLSAGFMATDQPRNKKDAMSIEFSAEQKPWKNFRSDIPTMLLLDWKLTANRADVRTTTATTRNDELAFTPFSFKTTDKDGRFTFKVSAGGGYVWAEETERATGTRNKTSTPTFAYSVEASYALGPGNCWSIGAAYTLKTSSFLSDTVSSAFGPKISYNLLCDKEQ